MADTDLAFVPLDELLAELGNRCNAMIWAGLMKTDESPTDEALTFHFTGGRWTCIGLLSDSIDILKRKRSDDDDDED